MTTTTKRTTTAFVYIFLSYLMFCFYFYLFFIIIFVCLFSSSSFFSYSTSSTKMGNPIWFIFWFLVFWFISFFVAFFCAGVYIILLIFVVCFPGLSVSCNIFFLIFHQFNIFIYFFLLYILVHNRYLTAVHTIPFILCQSYVGMQIPLLNF